MFTIFLKIFAALADLFNRHWIIKIVISFLPSIWFPIIVKYLCPRLFIVDGTQMLTVQGWFVTVLVYGLALAVLLISSYGAKIEAEKQNLLKAEYNQCKDTNAFYDKVIASVHSSHMQKSELLLSAASEYIEKGTTPYTTLTDPIQQLKNLSSEIKSCFNDLTDIPKDRIVVSMAYQLPDHEWHWVDHHVVKGGLTLQTLTTNSSTAFYRIINNEMSIIYINNKVESLKNREYISDALDGKWKNVGSLVCWKIEAKVSEATPIGRLVVSISSYGKQFSKDNEDDIQRVNESIDVVFRIFEEQIITELACLYILQNDNNKNETNFDENESS